MNEKDKAMMEKLMEDAGEKYSIVVDNDDVSVVNKATGNIEHSFNEFGYHLLVEVFQFLGLDAELC